MDCDIKKCNVLFLMVSVSMDSGYDLFFRDMDDKSYSSSFLFITKNFIVLSHLTKSQKNYNHI